MSPQPASLILYVLLTCTTHGQGLHLFLDTTPHEVYCGHLYCWTDNDTTSNNIQTVIGIAVYDVSKYSMSVEVVSLSVFGPDICQQESEVTSINATGNVSKQHAELVLAFTDTSYCLNGSFVCELKFVNRSGDPDVIRETVTSESSGNCYEVVKELVANIKRNFETEKKLAEMRKQYKVAKNEISNLRKMVNKSCEVPQCLRGMSHNNPRELFILWRKLLALCDTETDGGGWIVIQRRTKGDVDFYRDWKSYKNGFGTPDTDFWFGNDKIHNLTSQGYTELRVDMEYQGRQYYAHYSHFYVADENSKYRLSVSGYSGTAGDSLAYHNGSDFSTYDRDQDMNYNRNCAAFYSGAWWYNECFHSHLNGMWGVHNHSGVVWEGIVMEKSVSYSEMKIRHV